jgi:hypothetical protein
MRIKAGFEEIGRISQIVIFSFFSLSLLLLPLPSGERGEGRVRGRRQVNILPDGVLTEPGRCNGLQTPR